MPRVLVLWSRPQHLSAAEAERWARDEVRALLAADAVTSARLARLQRPSPRHGGEWDWLLELEVTAADCVDRGACAEWLGDLRLLGMRPSVTLVADGIALEGDER
jgi:hypothetical protein